MAAEDDMIVLVVVDDDEKTKDSHIEIKTEPGTSSDDFGAVNDIFETAEKHGKFIAVKLEPPDEEDCDYVDDEVLQKVIKTENIKSECNDDNVTNFDTSQEYSPDEEYQQYYEENIKYEDSERHMANKHRFSMLKPWQRRSFVAELRQEYVELREDEELLINTLEQIMRSVKPPPPPRDYYIMNGIMFECVLCGSLSDTIPAARRHYQEKHGQRYLVCYACGVDFRSTTNLYKHEKRCVAPDATVVLKARAACVGRKGRSRPFLRHYEQIDKADKASRYRFPCQLCSAVFMTRSNLQSHENLHRGERPYRCHACPCAYTSYSALSRHTKKHTDIQFICDHCSRSFKIKAALVSHMDTHKPMRKHGCNECTRRFAQKSALMLHVNRVHRNLPPPCACQICPKRYPRMSLLKAHMKRAHGMSIITRKMFFKSLPTMTESEIKQSKIILKSENDIDYEPPYDPEEMFRLSNIYENTDTPEKQVYTDIPNEQLNKSDLIEHMKITDFVQFVRKAPENMSNVIYIENGEIVDRMVRSDDNLILEVEDPLLE
ncbi:uncharacterized protein LOC142977944 [Anticarsia gemmatalis]|uniref:uncharacterized protein LOC142977944 n=1 Tax=Anticarsia gemmatalis TaxID=129554 RepID=UPI003F765C73